MRILVCPQISTCSVNLCCKVLIACLRSAVSRKDFVIYQRNHHSAVKGMGILLYLGCFILQSNFNGSNTFGTMKISSSQG